MTLTPSRKKSALCASLRTDRVLTTVQLERQGLMTAADALDLPRVTLTCRTRVTQPHSDVSLTFVALEESFLERPAQVLMHDVGVAEARQQCPGLVGGTLRHLELRGHGRGHLPDAVYLAPGLRTALDWAIEFDAGYDPGRIEQKLRAADREGYANYLLATTVQVRTGQIGPLIRKFPPDEPLLHLRRVETRYVNFWSLRDPYRTSRRTHKRLTETVASPFWEAVAR